MKINCQIIIRVFQKQMFAVDYKYGNIHITFNGVEK